MEKVMKAKPMKFDGKSTYSMCEPHEATHVSLRTPGPFYHRLIPVVQGSTTRKDTPCWTWNGDTEKPTLRPSIRTIGGENDGTCHSWVTDGKIQFLPDCTHDLAGQTLDLLDVE